MLCWMDSRLHHKDLVATVACSRAGLRMVPKPWWTECRGQKLIQEEDVRAAVEEGRSGWSDWSEAHERKRTKCEHLIIKGREQLGKVHTH